MVLSNRHQSRTQSGPVKRTEDPHASMEGPLPKLSAGEPSSPHPTLSSGDQPQISARTGPGATSLLTPYGRDADTRRAIGHRYPHVQPMT